MTQQQSNTEEPDCLPAWTLDAVLVYGPRKGGTTLLLNLLDSNDATLCFPSEVKLKFFRETLFSRQPHATRQYYSFSNILGKSYQGFNDSKYAAWAKEMETRTANSLGELLQYDIWGIFNSLTEPRKPPKLWAMKEVGGRTTETIRLFRQMFFGGKVLMIFRNPLSVTRSVILDRRRKGVRLNIRELVFQTRDPLRVMCEQSKLIGMPGIHCLLYEDLVGDGLTSAMEEACHFLNIPCSDIFKRPSIFGKAVVVDTSSRKTTKVFANIHPWHDSLTWRERMVVLGATLAIRLKGVLSKTPVAYYKQIAKKIHDSQ